MEQKYERYIAINLGTDFWATVYRSSSAIAEGPRDALSQLKSCQLLHNCTKNIAGRFFGLVTKHACNRQTDWRMDRQAELRLPRPR